MDDYGSEETQRIEFFVVPAEEADPELSYKLIIHDTGNENPRYVWKVEVWVGEHLVTSRIL